MLFTRDGHNVFLGDMYRGRSAFLICSGPSLAQQDLSRLNDRGVLTMAVNNAAVIHRPQLWCSVDDPGNFCDAIWKDPAITKFVPLCHMEKPITTRDPSGDIITSEQRVGDMPAVFGLRRNETFQAGQWLYEDTFNWGNQGKRTDEHGNKGSRSVMYLALRLLFYLGIRRVTLLGCDFRMQTGAQNYAFPQDRTRASVRGNNASYRILNDRLTHLLPHFEQAGFEVFNATPDSGLTAFPTVSLDAALADAKAWLPSQIDTRGMYDRKQREKTASGKRAIRVAAESRVLEEINEPTAVVKDLTLITAIDAGHAKRLECTWPTWMRFRPELRDVPVIVVHDARFDPLESPLATVVRHPRLRFIPWEMPEADNQRERMLTALVKVAAAHIRTPWYLKLDSDVVATRSDSWLQDDWFRRDAAGRIPAYVASPWGYTKPADAIQRLDNWGDTINELRDQPRLDLPFEPGAASVRHSRIISWCFYGNTAWTRRVARYARGRLPVPSHDTYLYYCATRRGDFTRHVRMKDFGWEHISCFRKLQRRCDKVIHAPEIAGAGKGGVL